MKVLQCLSMKTPSELPTGYLKYLNGEAKDTLNNDFHGDDVPVTEAYRTTIKDAINTYCGLSDHAASFTASVIKRLPYHGKFEYEDALIGMHILTETQLALQEILETDAEFRQSMIGSTTSESVDSHVRNSAGEFDEHFDLRAKDDISREQERITATEEAEVRNSFYDGKDAAEVDKDVAHSMRDTLDGLGVVNVFSFDEPPADKNGAAEKPAPATPEPKPAAEEVPAVPAHPAMRLFGEMPTELHVDVPDFKGADPIIVFQKSTQWMADMIISIAAGSKKRDSFPRIAPLIGIEHESLSVTQQTLVNITRDIRRMTDKLRPPVSGGAGQVRDLLDALITHDPNDSQGLQDKMENMLRNLRGEQTEKEPEYKPWAEEGGGWEDS